MVEVHLIHSTNIDWTTTLSDPVPGTEETINKIAPAPKELTVLYKNLQHLRAQWENFLVSSILSGTVQISWKWESKIY